ncbi:hypothetical protein D9619_005141 [Psilocybe cf. subviscida]|uniref:HAT C-terminal dimerisation domain-containing protein n=1 Tax=Psilocybe cf. subviscida TaxID=2480587 RepID=A0A8H5BNV7_9AGAR|nr:hypothetical protein D9619_005141 [Psilocybe cf. subviscida]
MLVFPLYGVAHHSTVSHPPFGSFPNFFDTPSSPPSIKPVLQLGGTLYTSMGFSHTATYSNQPYHPGWQYMNGTTATQHPAQLFSPLTMQVVAPSNPLLGNITSGVINAPLTIHLMTSGNSTTSKKQRRTSQGAANAPKRRNRTGSDKNQLPTPTTFISTAPQVSVPGAGPQVQPVLISPPAASQSHGSVAAKPLNAPTHYGSKSENQIRMTQRNWETNAYNTARELVFNVLSEHERSTQGPCPAPRLPPHASHKLSLRQTLKKSSSLSAIPTTSDNDGIKISPQQSAEELAHLADEAGKQHIEAEIKAYEDAGLIDEDEPLDLLRFWQDHMTTFLLLYQIALDVLPAQASVVPCERVFLLSKETAHQFISRQDGEVSNPQVWILKRTVELHRGPFSMYARGKIAQLEKLIMDSWGNRPETSQI